MKLGMAKVSYLILSIFLLTSCSGLVSGSPTAEEQLTVRETAERIIANDIASAIGQGTLEPVCLEVVNPAPNTTFDCSAEASDNRFVYLKGKVETDGRISLVTTNVLLSTDLPKYEGIAIAYVNQQLSSEYAANTLSCGESTIILNPERVISCSFIEPGSGDIFDAEVRIDDFSTQKVRVRIADQPRA